MGHCRRLQLITLAMVLPLAFAEASWAVDLQREVLQRLDSVAGRHVESLEAPSSLSPKQKNNANSRKVEADRLLDLGIEQYNRDDWRGALENWQKALVIYQDIEDRVGEVQTLNIIGNVYRLLGVYSEALENYNQSLMITREINDPFGEAQILNNIGNVYRLLGAYSEALENYEQSLLIRRELGDQEGEANTLVEIGIVNQNLGNYSEALAFYEQSLVISQEIEDRTNEASTLSNIGNVYRLSGSYSEALENYEQSLMIIREIGNRSGEALILNNIATVYNALGNYPEALENYEQSLVITREIGNRSGEALILNNIATVYDALGNYPEALGYFEEALAIKLEIGDRRGEGLSISNIAIVYSSQGEYEKALELYQQSLAIFQEVGERVNEANTHNRIGEIQRHLKRYRLAILSHQTSLNLFRELGFVADESQTLNSLGLVYQDLGAYEEALNRYEESLKIKQEIKDLKGQANTLNNIGLIYQVQGNKDIALNYYRQSLKIFEKVGDSFGQGTTLSNIALIHQDNEEYDVALELYSNSLEIFRQGRFFQKEAQVINNIALIYEANEEPEKALLAHQESLVLKRRIGDRLGEGNTLNNIGHVLAEQNQVELAIVFLKQSVNVFELIREENQELSKELQELHLRTFEDVYRSLADLLLQQDRIIEAQRVLDLLKVQELDGYLRGVRRTEDTEDGAEYLQPEAILTADYNQLVDRAVENGIHLRELQVKDVLTSDEEQQLDQLLDNEQDIRKAFANFIESDRVQEELAKLSIDETERNLQLSQLNGLQDNLKALEQDAVLLYPFILEDRLELILVTPYSPPIRRTVSVGRGDVNKIVGNLRIALENPGVDAKASARTLYDWLIAPIKEDLEKAGAKTIIYTPDRTLRYIPLATLYNAETDKWLIEDYAVNNITAASLTDFNTESQTSLEILAAAFASGSHDVAIGERSIPFNGLRFAGEEVNNLQKLVPDMTLLVDDTFSRSAVRREANRHTLVHLATHAKFLVGTPEESFILFGNGEKVTLADLKAGWLTLTQVDLFVLSACETGVSNTTYTNNDNGEEILGFGYLMQEAGARASMASLWSVDDGGTQVLMNGFYDTLVRGGLSKANALQLAQKQMIGLADDANRGSLILDNPDLDIDPTDLSHPHYWAPFVLIGNGL